MKDRRYFFMAIGLLILGNSQLSAKNLGKSIEELKLYKSQVEDALKVVKGGGYKPLYRKDVRAIKHDVQSRVTVIKEASRRLEMLKEKAERLQKDIESSLEEYKKIAFSVDPEHIQRLREMHPAVRKRVEKIMEQVKGL